MRPSFRSRVALLTLALIIVSVGGFLFFKDRQTPAPYQLPARPAEAAGATIPGLTTADLQAPPEVSPEIAEIMEKTAGESPEGESKDDPDRRSNWYWDQRAYPLDTIPYDANIKALQYVEQSMPVAAQDASQAWQSLGPNPISNGLVGLHDCDQVDCGAWRTNVSGRTKVIVFNPQNPNIVYVGTATGGIWKSTDGGNSYTPLTDNLPSMAFHSLVLDPQNPNILYAGSGEISGYYGVGLFKSTDGGQTWALRGQNEFGGIVISAIAINPNNTNIVYAATTIIAQPEGPASPTRGVFRSTDGGNTWAPLLTCTTCYGVTDLVMEDANPQILYAGAAGYGIFKTTDGGDNWAQLTNGLPDRGFLRVELGIAHGGNSGVIYAGLDARVAQGNQVVPWGLIYKSVDHGASWQPLQNAPNYCSSQCGYDNVITVHPTDPNTVYIGGSFISGDNGWRGMVHKTTDGGQSWQDVTPGTAVNHIVHPDMHAISFKPGNPNEVWIGDDGGVFRTTNGGGTWEQRSGNLATLQFINIGIHPTDPTIAFGGLQDNAKAKFSGGGWTGLDTGDGGFSEIDPFSPNIWYSTRYSQQGSFVSFQRNEKGGTAPLSDWLDKSDGININDRMLFYVPFTLDPSTAGVLYLGTDHLYRTADRGDNWQVISSDLTGAPTLTAPSPPLPSPPTIPRRFIPALPTVLSP